MKHTMMHTATTAVVLAVAILATSPRVSNADRETYELRSARQAGQIDRVESTLEMNGDVIEKTDQKEGKEQKQAVSVVCNRNYDERTLEIPSDPTGRWRSIRCYDTATAVVKKGESINKPGLRPERRLIGAEVAAGKTTLFSPSGPLTSDELEVVIALGDSLPLDRFSPTSPVALGDKWKAPDQLMAALFDLDEVGSNGVELELKTVTPELARMEMAGQITGKRYAAAINLGIQAKCRFHRKTNRIDWFVLAVKEKRETSVVEAAMDITVRLQMKISRKDASEQLTDAALKGVPLESSPALCRLICQPADAGWQLTHDRCWFLTADHRDLKMFQRLEQGENVAMCKFSPLPKIDPKNQVALEQFQSDVQRALGKNFGDIVEAAQSANSANYRVYRVIAKGQDAGAAALWHYYLVSDEQGHQAAFAFRVEEKQAEQFAGAGERLVQSLRFVNPQVAGKEKTGTEKK